MFPRVVSQGGWRWRWRCASRVRAELSSSISASEGVIISHPGVTGANTVIWREGSGGKNLEEDVVMERAIRRRTWREGALKARPGNGAGLSPAHLVRL